MNNNPNNSAAKIVSEQHDMIHAANGLAQAPVGFKPNQHPDAQWFYTAGLGMFVHWGLSCVDGETDLSWGMIKQRPGMNTRFRVTPPKYYSQVERFDPQNYDPEKWLAKAAEAGFQYAVLTTKHHEGFAMWPSEHGDLNTKNHMRGRDLVRPFVDACRNVGLKVGLYFSPPDWWYCRNHMSFSYPDQPPVDFHHCPAVIPKPPPEFGERLVRYTRNQIEELLSNYGSIDIMFFDGCVSPDFSDSHVAISMERLRELQPGMLVNPRMHGYGDYLTPESHMPETKPAGFFEFCDISDKNAWGYLNNQKRDYFSTSRFIGRLAQCRAWGGNYLLNFGPDPDGDLPPEAYNAIRAIGTGLQKGES
jgi:alpha-L-fucosidase